jgi:hypothetical protein
MTSRGNDSVAQRIADAAAIMGDDLLKSQSQAAKLERIMNAFEP